MPQLNPKPSALKQWASNPSTALLSSASVLMTPRPHRRGFRCNATRGQCVRCRTRRSATNPRFFEAAPVEHLETCFTAETRRTHGPRHSTKAKPPPPPSTFPTKVFAETGLPPTPQHPRPTFIVLCTPIFTCDRAEADDAKRLQSKP